MSTAVHAFQIYYNEATRVAIDPDFEPLDNLANERPEWCEYLPIRKYFARNTLDDESAYYGFFSPAFGRKTGIRGAELVEFVRQSGGADVVTFSPYLDSSALFQNVFEQGATLFDGFLDAADAVAHLVDPRIRLSELVQDARTTVYSNFFVARPAFWREWRRIFTQCFDAAETPGSDLYGLLNRPIRYADDQGRKRPMDVKIMVLERLASLLLSTGRYRVRNYRPFDLPIHGAIADYVHELVAFDALKVAYQATGERYFLKQFREARDRLFAAIAPRLKIFRFTD